MQRLMPIEELAQRARDLYSEQIAAKVAPADHSKFLVVDVESGDFEIGADEDKILDRLEARQPNGQFFLMRADGGPSMFLTAMRGV